MKLVGAGAQSTAMRCAGGLARTLTPASPHLWERLTAVYKVDDRVPAAVSVRVTRREIARDLGAFLDIAADRHRRGRRAAPVGLLKTVIAAVEAGDHAGAAFAGGGFGIDQRLHLAAPFVALVGPADAAQIVQPTENLRQPLQIAVKRRCPVLSPRGHRGTGENQGKNGQKSRRHRPGVCLLGAVDARRGGQGPISRWADWMTSSSPPV